MPKNIRRTAWQRIHGAMALLLVLCVQAHSQENASQRSGEASSRVAVPDGSFPRMKEFSADDIEQGRQSMNILCARCHGRDGRGGKGPNLTEGVFRHVRTDKDIIDIITIGISGTGMPGFGATYEDYYLPVLAYIRAESAKSEGKAEPLAGVATRGKQLFVKHQCGSCHWDGMAGGRLGTNLAQLTATASYVRESLINPSSQVDGTHQKVKLMDQYGRTFSGKRLRENTYDILIMDDQQNLHSIAKQELAELKYAHESMMPSFGDVLSKEDIEDLTAYLFSLQKANSQ